MGKASLMSREYRMIRSVTGHALAMGEKMALADLLINALEETEGTEDRCRYIAAADFLLDAGRISLMQHFWLLDML